MPVAAARPRTRKVVHPPAGALPCAAFFAGDAFELLHLHLEPEPPIHDDARWLVFIFLEAKSPTLRPFGRIWADMI
jgi:hypothetical protein